MSCPLCLDTNHSLFYEDKARTYYQCGNCFLIFVPPKFWTSQVEEKEIYDLHQNSPLDLGYRKFLSRLFDPLVKKLTPNSKGLDFGCGNGPTLSVMLEEKGHSVELFDLYYANDLKVFSKKYDFIVATEVIEHLGNPNQEITRLISLLRPEGLLGVMTKLARDQSAFSTWHYKNDITHICFYSVKTFEWIAKHWSMEIEFVGNDVVILKACT
ncbi:MAG: class I SAM-dependent methyltransferase [Bacteriovoracaceae bacterium]|jgi:hypothetical protein|nr:class I SAM-dependent methyltransferase [Bacteriovoracaceae bacterium]